eukprot:gene10944-17058_t
MPTMPSTAGTALKNSILAGLSVVIMHFVFKNLAASQQPSPEQRKQSCGIPRFGKYRSDHGGIDHEKYYYYSADAAEAEAADAAEAAEAAADAYTDTDDEDVGVGNTREDADMINYLYGRDKEQFTASAKDATPLPHHRPKRGEEEHRGAVPPSPLGPVDAFEGFVDDGLNLASALNNHLSTDNKNAAASLDALFAPLN